MNEANFSDLPSIYDRFQISGEKNPFADAFAGLGDIYKEEGDASHITEDMLDDNNVMYELTAGGMPAYAQKHIDEQIAAFVERYNDSMKPWHNPFELGGAL